MTKYNFINKVLTILILTFIVSITFAFTTQTSVVNADSDYTPQISVQNKTVHRGQTFEVDVSISGNEGLITMLLSLDYDTSAMVLKEVLRKDALGNMTYTSTNVETEQGYAILPFKMLFDASSPDATNGVFITLVFDTFIEAPIGDYEISLTYDSSNTNKAYKEPIALDIQNGIITLITGEYNAIYLDYDNTVLYEKDYNADDVPSYVGDFPVRPEDDEYTYVFSEFTGIVSDDLNTLKFMAVYNKTPKVYTVFYYVDGIDMDYLDNQIDDNDYFTSNDYPFGEFIEEVQVPLVQFYEFVGWYTDDSFTSKYLYGTMPSHNLRLYGYYKYEVRDKDIPIIELSVVNQTEDTVKINANLIKNTGLNGMVLTLSYNHNVFEFVSFNKGEALSKLQFATTNLQKMQSENFKFYFEGAVNSYDTGIFLEMEFNIIDKVNANLYDITLTYEKNDATYIDMNKDIKYTMLSIYKAQVPIGVIYEWNQMLGDVEINVISDIGLPINVKMVVESIMDEIDIPRELIDKKVGKNMQLLSAYRIKLYQNNVEYIVDTNFTIKIKLNEKEQQSSLLKLFMQNKDNELSLKDFTINGIEMSFKTSSLDNCLIFGNYGYSKVIGSESRIVMLISFPILLAITTMFYAFVINSKKKLTNKEANDVK